jgi:anion-transporting  ArsA/GET3 family ATPase
MTDTTNPLDVLRSSPVVLCLGPGGVGKTTTAAALAVAAAEDGRRAVVLTIDPARRLADAMGLSDSDGKQLDNDARRITGPWSGELWASMLDASATFDDLIREHATTKKQADRIIGNRLYQNLTTSLSGTNEYMAAERLRSLHLDDRFDVVIVDTPPSKHAFDFLDSPRRLTRFFDHRLYKSVLAPRRGLLKAMNSATNLMLRALSRVVGAAFVEDVIDFFDAFEGIDRGFSQRAGEVAELLVDPSTAYVVVSAARHDPLREATWIGAHLRDRKRRVALLVVNRLTPDFDPPGAEFKTHAAAQTNLRQLNSLAEAERHAVADLAATIGADATALVIEEPTTVSDLDGVGSIAGQLRGIEPDISEMS